MQWQHSRALCWWVHSGCTGLSLLSPLNPSWEPSLADMAAVKGFATWSTFLWSIFLLPPLPCPALGCCPPTVAVTLAGTPLTPSYEPHYFCSMSQVLKTRYVHLVSWWLRHPSCSRWKENAQDGVIIIYVSSSLGSFAMYMLKQRCFFRRNVYAKLNLSHQKEILKFQSKHEIKQISVCWWVVEFVIQTSDCNL